MKLTRDMKIAGEMAMRNLSDEAYAMYIVTDPMDVYMTSEGRFSVRGVEDLDNVTLEDIEELLLDLRNSPANDETTPERQAEIWKELVGSIRECAVNHAIPYTTMISAINKDIDQMSVRVFTALADSAKMSLDETYDRVKYDAQ